MKYIKPRSVFVFENMDKAKSIFNKKVQDFEKLKRGIMGIYHSMSKKHLQRYVDEFVFRYNTRGFSESYRLFHLILIIQSHSFFYFLIQLNFTNIVKNI